MEFGPVTLILLPLGLGLLGFVEPCTVGAHLLFLRALADRRAAGRLAVCAVFVAARTATAGAVGAMAALLAERLVVAQTTVWLLFGIVYCLLALFYLTGRIGWLELPVRLVPAALAKTRHTVLLGIGFGLNIPACAAPILFGLFGVAASAGSVAAGFVAMAVFGLALSLPLVLFVVQPALVAFVGRIGRDTPRVHRVLGLVFLLLGLWSVWFGLFVEPADWAPA